MPMIKISTGKKFEVTDVTPPYQPRERPEPKFDLIKDLDSDCEGDRVSSHRLYLTREAMRQIADHIGWGQHTNENHVEQGGILVGEVFTDTQQSSVYGVVEAAIPGRSARGTSGYLEMGHDTWLEMLNSVDGMLNLDPEKASQIIGWYHTHPNNLSVFMSGTDHATQSRLFAHAWQFAMVLNPQRRSWRAFFGPDAKECNGHVIRIAELRFTEPDSTNQPDQDPQDPKDPQETETTPSESETPELVSAGIPIQDELAMKTPRLLWVCFFLLLAILGLDLVLVYTVIHLLRR